MSRNLNVDKKTEVYCRIAQEKFKNFICRSKNILAIGYREQCNKYHVLKMKEIYRFIVFHSKNWIWVRNPRLPYPK